MRAPETAQTHREQKHLLQLGVLDVLVVVLVALTQ
jgi:hypothetical protein